VRTPFDDLVAEFTPRPPARAAWWGFVVILALIFALVLSLHFISRAYAQDRPRFTLDCRELAAHISLAAWARDMRADENMVAIYFSKANQHLGYNLVRALEREVRRLWKEKHPAGKAVEAAHQRCQAQLGDMGMEG